MKSERYIFVLCTLFIVTLSFVVTGCRPRGILSSREMREVLVDLHKTDAIIQMQGVRFQDHEIKDIYYAETLEKHGVTQAQFDSSLVWYTAHPQFFNKIYPKVIKELDAQEEAFLAAHEELLNKKPEKPAHAKKAKEFKKADLDSVLWVTQHGYPNSWNPLVHDFVDELFPQIGVSCGGVVDSLETSVRVSEITHD